MPKAKPWTNDDIKQLKALFDIHTNSTIATRLGRSTDSIAKKLGNLGLVRSKIKPPPPQRRKADPYRATNICEWPIGNPRLPDFRFCDDPRQEVHLKMPYCGKHAMLAYFKKAHDCG